MLNLFALAPVVEAQPRPAETVLEWARDLDAHRSRLEAEADRIEQLLGALSQPLSAAGADLNAELVLVLQAQLEGVCLLLDFHDCGEEELLQQSIACLLDSDARLQQLELCLEEMHEALPLVA
jgi:hypothetical protein